MSNLNALFFMIGFVWLLASACSVVIGPFVGVDRDKIKSESIEFWEGSLGGWRGFLKKALILFVFLSLLLPIVYPIIGFVVGLMFIFVGS